MYYCSLQLRIGVFSGYLLFHKCVGMYYLVLESPHISTVRKYLPHCSHLIKEKMSDNSIQNGIFVNWAFSRVFLNINFGY